MGNEFEFEYFALQEKRALSCERRRMKRLLADVQPIIATNYSSAKVGLRLFCCCRTSRQLERTITKGSQSAI